VIFIRRLTWIILVKLVGRDYDSYNFKKCCSRGRGQLKLKLPVSNYSSSLNNGMNLLIEKGELKI